jgi:hypothetical protein
MNSDPDSATLSTDHQSAALQRLINGFQISQAIHVAVTLGIPDLLGDRSLCARELAELKNSHAGSLYRLLRALAAIGILQESGDRRFALTPLGARLRSDRKGGRAFWAGFAASPPHWASWGALLHTVRTGENAFQHIHGQSVWAFRAAHPKHGALFDAAMREGSERLLPELMTAYDFSQAGHIVDVGGGDGALLSGLLAAYPSLKGTLVDLPGPASRAAHRLSEAGLAGRCAILAGSFFDQVPRGGDLYILKHILHDWRDAEAAAILRNCRLAMGSGAKLLLIERLIGEPNQQLEAKLADLHMLVNAGGRERTSDEFQLLLSEAGFELQRTTALPEERVLLEALPV